MSNTAELLARLDKRVANTGTEHPDAAACIRAQAARIAELEAFLHSRRYHPHYEYATTTGPRKGFDEHEPEGEGWERNVHVGRNGWERFDYHEEAYWMRKALRAAETKAPGPVPPPRPRYKEVG